MEVDELKWQRKQKKASLEYYNNRVKSINDIISNIDTKLEGEIDSLNTNISDGITKLNDSLRIPNVQSLNNVINELYNSKEPYPYIDGNIYQCRAYLASEANNCYTNINSLSGEISILENEIINQGGILMPWE